MRTLLVVPLFGDPFEWACDAVLQLQRRTPRNPVLEPTDSSAAMADAAVDMVFGNAAGVLFTSDLHLAGGKRARFFRNIDRLRTEAPDLPLLVVVGSPSLGRDSPPVVRAVRALAHLGINEVVMVPDDGTSPAIARRLEALLCSPFARDFLTALASSVSNDLWFVLSKLLHDQEEGVRASDAELAEACGWDMGELVDTLQRQGLGTLEVWRHRIHVYAAIRGDTEGGGNRARGSFRVGRGQRGQIGTLEAACRRLTGSGADAFSAPEGWRRFLEVLARRISESATRDGTTDVGTDDDSAPRPETVTDASSFETLFGTHWCACVQAAEAVLRCTVRAEDAAQEVFTSLWRMGPDKWPTVTSSYITTAALNQARDMMKARPWEREAPESEVLRLASGERAVDLGLEEAEVVHQMRARYQSLSPRQAVAAWLSDVRGWRPREIQRLLGCTSSSFRNLRDRARKALRSRT